MTDVPSTARQLVRGMPLETGGKTKLSDQSKLETRF